MKKCTRCGKEKSLSEFHRRSRSFDGRTSQCKACRVEAESDRQQRVARQEKTIPEEKICPNCGETKPANAFHKNRVRPDGLSSYCAKCKSGVHRRWRGRIAEQEKAIPEQKRCPTCGETKPAINFYQYNASPDGLDSRCKDCKDHTIARWRESHPKGLIAQKAVAYAVMKGELPHVSEHNCENCGVTAEHYHHPDYDQPLDVVPLCASCHRQRHLIDEGTA